MPTQCQSCGSCQRQRPSPRPNWRGDAMTADRANAYNSVATLLRELGPAKLTPSDQQRIREAADDLIFAASLVSDERAQDAVRDIGALSRHLVDAGRWSRG